MNGPVYIEYEGVRYEAVGRVRDMILGVNRSKNTFAQSDGRFCKCDPEESSDLEIRLANSVPTKTYQYVLDTLNKRVKEKKEVQERLNECLRLICDMRGPLYDHDMHSWENKCDNIIAKYGSGKGSK